MLPDDLVADAARLLQELRDRDLMLATAESCTGGLIIGTLTEVAGSSDVVDRGFVTYSNASKHQMLGVANSTLDRYGAVSREVALEMLDGAQDRAAADITVVVTGVAGPGGGSEEKPIGLVHIAAVRHGRAPIHRECRFGDIGRSAIRERTVKAAFELVRELVY